ncbi:hypothetical protein YH62_17030 [Rhizobium sp. LC145]|nr:hypothetical protein YH62_17030 [Rhizobium sp. LC145]
MVRAMTIGRLLTNDVLVACAMNDAGFKISAGLNRLGRVVMVSDAAMVARPRECEQADRHTGHQDGEVGKYSLHLVSRLMSCVAHALRN